MRNFRAVPVQQKYGDSLKRMCETAGMNVQSCVVFCAFICLQRTHILFIAAQHQDRGQH